MGLDVKIAPSLLSADFGKLAEEIVKVEQAGADLLHLDVMDGHFVDNITIGPVVVKDIKKYAKVPLDVHLMIEQPERYIDAFANAGSDIITFHIEVTKDNAAEIIKKIKVKGIKAGIVLNPDTPIESIDGLLDKLDMVLIMSVFPGFAGQSFIYDVLTKIIKLRKRFDGDIEIDGGINEQTVKVALKAGANMIVAGSYVFGSGDYQKAIDSLKILPYIQ